MALSQTAVPPVMKVCPLAVPVFTEPTLFAHHLSVPATGP